LFILIILARDLLPFLPCPVGMKLVTVVEPSCTFNLLQPQSKLEKEYSADWRLIKGGVTARRVALKSKYEQDVYINGHMTVWGSYFHRGVFRWGYADDHSLMKNSYCTGENGRIANDEANEMRYGTGVSGWAALAQAREFLKAIPTGERKAGVVLPAMSKLYGEADQNAKFDKDKLDRALKKVDQSCEEATEDRKRKYNSLITLS
jgi:pre-mRNA-processing factor SLU7